MVLPLKHFLLSEMTWLPLPDRAYSLIHSTPQVFTSLSLFLMLIGPLNAFPWVINGLVEAWVSLKRVQAFIHLKDIDLHDYYTHSTRECFFQFLLTITPWNCFPLNAAHSNAI